LITALACVLIFVLRWAILPVLGVCAAIGAVLGFMLNAT
jgi:hypothetical protein